MAGIFIDDSYGFDCDAPWRTHLTYERVHIHHVDVHHQQPRAIADPTEKTVGGLGISLGGVEGAVVERSVVRENGRADQLVINGGLGSHNSNHVLMQYNEVYGTRSLADGVGMGFDRWTTNSILQYNFTHDNDGPGIMIGGLGDVQMVENNTIRHNFLQNDSRRQIFEALLFESWSASEVDVYGNTIYVEEIAPGAGAPAAIGFIGGCPWMGCLPEPPQIRVYNNLFYTRYEDVEVVPSVHVWPGLIGYTSGLKFLGNDYFTGPGKPFLVYWGEERYHSLEAFREAQGQEIYNGQDVGTEADPVLSGIRTELTVRIDRIDELHALLVPLCKLQMDAPDVVRTGGMNLFGQLGLVWNPNDYWKTNWLLQWGEDYKDPFGEDLPLNARLSIGVSQWPSQP